MVNHWIVQNLCISRGKVADKRRAKLLYKGVLVSTLELPNKRKKSVVKTISKKGRFKETRQIRSKFGEVSKERFDIS
ncbi:hypothetical protein SAMN04488029_0677 [Reichenbachiella faecimaris]|uniref:Uncharacterized protein n=1 Tax=Reichenbachiella faecimaris TaxID=692418 RepID=A0A1W2G7C1_REIFA|nr:hypothetical protein SAMN04488029_0677 [Reichenbachiella faecimaris]